MDCAKNVLISVSRFAAHGCVQVCVLAVQPVLPSRSINLGNQSVHLHPVQYSYAGRTLT
jgi:hypothetical protein